jgi:hypothetical protein
VETKEVKRETREEKRNLNDFYSFLSLLFHSFIIFINFYWLVFNIFNILSFGFVFCFLFLLLFLFYFTLLLASSLYRANMSNIRVENHIFRFRRQNFSPLIVFCSFAKEKKDILVIFQFFPLVEGVLFLVFSPKMGKKAILSYFLCIHFVSTVCGIRRP